MANMDVATRLAIQNAKIKLDIPGPRLQMHLFDETGKLFERGILPTQHDTT